MRKQILKVQPLETMLNITRSECKTYWNGALTVIVTYSDGNITSMRLTSCYDKTKLKCATALMKQALKMQRVATLEIFEEL